MAMVRVMSGIVESEKLASKSSGSESSRAEVDGPKGVEFAEVSCSPICRSTAKDVTID